MSSIFGRAIIIPKTNKSGGALAKGDVVIVDAANDNAVTTTTSGSYTGVVGVVVEENGIANNATGRVQFGGHCALITPNASVTRGHYALTHTVAKQCTDGGASRVTGAFGVFTTGGTTPEIDLFTQPDGSSASGAMASDPLWDAAGDLAQGTGANTGAKLPLGTAGQLLQVNAGATAAAWASVGAYLQTFLTGDVSMTNANQYYDGPAVPLSAGTWLILANVTIAWAAASQFTCKIWDGTTVGAASEGSNANSNMDKSLSCVVVIASGTPSWKISVASTGAGNTMKATPPDNASGLTNLASSIRAIRIA